MGPPVPVEYGAFHKTVAFWFGPAVAETASGADGSDGFWLGTAGSESGDAAPVPTAFAAATDATYCAPLVRPLTGAETGDAAQALPLVQSTVAVPAIAGGVPSGY